MTIKVRGKETRRYDLNIDHRTDYWVCRDYWESACKSKKGGRTSKIDKRDRDAIPRSSKQGKIEL